MKLMAQANDFNGSWQLTTDS